jgi:hypothetical protein
MTSFSTKNADVSIRQYIRLKLTLNKELYRGQIKTMLIWDLYFTGHNYMKSAIFWDFISYRPIKVYRSFAETLPLKTKRRKRNRMFATLLLRFHFCPENGINILLRISANTQEIIW